MNVSFDADKVQEAEEKAKWTVEHTKGTGLLLIVLHCILHILVTSHQLHENGYNSNRCVVCEMMYVFCLLQGVQR